MRAEYAVPVVSAVICLLTIAGCWLYLDRTLNRISAIISGFITNRKADASDLAETRESKLITQLKQLIAILNHEANTSREDKEAISRLVSDLSHQLKTPLANIAMYTELLKDSTLSEGEKQEFILRTAEQASKMEWLMQTLLKTSRLEVGMIEFEVMPGYIKETIANSISAVYAQAAGKNIRIVTNEFPDIKLMHNPKWTAEAISNILENAIKYSGESAEISITVEKMEFYTRIEVRDAGIGIAPSEYNLIFQRFYRSKQVENKEGSGLGLYLSQLILSKEGGYITVASEQGKGSSFFLFLPNAREKR